MYHPSVSMPIFFTMDHFKQEKRLFNRFDQYEIASMFTESAEQYLTEKYTPRHTRFWLKCLLGILLTINGYLSHWGPWSLPNNLPFFIFSIVFYSAASYTYSKISVVDPTQGNMIGQFTFSGRSLVAVLRFGQDKSSYELQLQTNDKLPLKIQFKYYDYVTENGYLLEDNFHQHLAEFIEKAML